MLADKISDEALMWLVSTGSKNRQQEAMHILYQRYAGKLVSYLSLVHKSQSVAEDIAHDVFLKIYQSPHLYQPGLNFSGWLFRIATNLSRNNFRHQKVKLKFNESFENELSENAKPPSVPLYKGIQLLDFEHREVVVLKYKFEMSTKEIASIVSCPEGTIKSRLFYALKKLRQYIKPEDYE
ncbi:MAG: hypothetical protein C0594_05020 [Marinilabiliales bacterium]|nr:MAG: hypothetical protein C0594_05020 [Marinilabiliales bacterium]